MQISFNQMLNTNKTQNVTQNKPISTENVNSTSSAQRKSFDEILISTTNTASANNINSSYSNINTNSKVEYAKSEIISEAKTPKSQEFLNNLKSEIESGNYQIDANKLAKNLISLGV